MSMVFTQLLFINFCQDETVQLRWDGPKFDELLQKINSYALETRERVIEEKSNTTQNAIPGKDDENKKIPPEKEKVSQKPESGNWQKNGDNDAKIPADDNKQSPKSAKKSSTCRLL